MFLNSYVLLTYLVKWHSQMALGVSLALESLPSEHLRMSLAYFFPWDNSILRPEILNSRLVRSINFSPYSLGFWCHV